MTDLQPYQRFDRWWDANGAHIETLIVANNYPRKWAYSQRDILRAWIVNNPKRSFTERGWKRRVGTWLANGWFGFMTDEQRQEIRSSESGRDRSYDGPPEV